MPRKKQMKPTSPKTEEKVTGKNTSTSPRATRSPWLTKAEAAEYLGKSIAWLTQAMRFNQIPYYKPGHSVHFKKDDLDAYIERGRMEAAPTPRPAPVKDREYAPMYPTADPENTMEFILNGELYRAYKVGKRPKD